MDRLAECPLSYRGLQSTFRNSRDKTIRSQKLDFERLQAKPEVVLNCCQQGNALIELGLGAKIGRHKRASR